MGWAGSINIWNPTIAPPATSAPYLPSPPNRCISLHGRHFPPHESHAYPQADGALSMRHEEEVGGWKGAINSREQTGADN